jgi:hypothetical protein
VQSVIFKGIFPFGFILNSWFVGVEYNARKYIFCYEKNSALTNSIGIMLMIVKAKSDDSYPSWGQASRPVRKDFAF